MAHRFKNFFSDGVDNTSSKSKGSGGIEIPDKVQELMKEKAVSVLSEGDVVVILPKFKDDDKSDALQCTITTIINSTLGGKMDNTVDLSEDGMVPLSSMTPFNGEKLEKVLPSMVASITALVSGDLCVLGDGEEKGVVGFVEDVIEPGISGSVMITPVVQSGQTINQSEDSEMISSNEIDMVVKRVHMSDVIDEDDRPDFLKDPFEKDDDYNGFFDLD